MLYPRWSTVLLKTCYRKGSPPRGPHASRKLPISLPAMSPRTARVTLELPSVTCRVPPCSQAPSPPSRGTSHYEKLPISRIPTSFRTPHYEITTNSRNLTSPNGQISPAGCVPPHPTVLRIVLKGLFCQNLLRVDYLRALTAGFGEAEHGGGDGLSGHRPPGAHEADGIEGPQRHNSGFFSKAVAPLPD